MSKDKTAIRDPDRIARLEKLLEHMSPAEAHAQLAAEDDSDED